MCSRSACAIFTYIPQALPRKHVSLHDLHSLQAEGGLWTSMYVSKLKGFDKVNWNYVSASQEFPRVQFLTYALHIELVHFVVKSIANCLWEAETVDANYLWFYAWTRLNAILVKWFLIFMRLKRLMYAVKILMEIRPHVKFWFEKL